MASGIGVFIIFTPEPSGARELARGVFASPRDWPIWQLRPAGRNYLCVVTVVGFLACLSSIANVGAWSSSTWGRFALLVAMSIAYAEASSRITRLRRFLSSDSVNASATSTVLLAGVLVLPWSGAILLGAVVYLHTYMRSRRHRAVRPYRYAFSSAVNLLAVLVGSIWCGLTGVRLSHVGPTDALAITALTGLYVFVQVALLVPGIYLAARPPSLRSVIPSRTEIGNEVSTLFIGVLAGVVVFHAALLSPVILIVLAVWHRATLVTQLQHSARVDGKTGLLNAGAWRVDAEHALAESETASLLLIDLDHFKLVNDGYGHLTGDAALVDVAEVLRRELRGFDAVGRYGGEEFVALLPGVAGFPARLVAERLRVCISELIVNGRVRLTASIGVATTGPSIATLDELIEAADKAMYVAKSHGRDQVSPG